MKQLFTVHAGEYLAGSYIEEHYPKWNVWVSSKDTGVDLLVTDTRNARAVSLQVKFSKDFTPTHPAGETRGHPILICESRDLTMHALSSGVVTSS